MSTIVDYVREEQRTFIEKPFCPVDSLVLSSLVYLNFEASGLIKTHDPARVLLHDVIMLTPFEELTDLSWLHDSDLTGDFIQAVAASRRLRDVHIAYFCNDVFDSIDKQFSAVTFILSQPDSEDPLLFVAYRGTDGTVTGWKEDFDLSFKDVIPSQIAARDYLTRIAELFEGPLILGGHSKGGNLAEYAALTCDEAVYSRIIKICDHDGPAFCKEPSARIRQPHYQDILCKTVPVSSIFGLILEDRVNYRIVVSDAPPIASHSPFTWQVDADNFVFASKLTRGSEIFDESLKNYLRDIDNQTRELVVDTVFELIRNTDAQTWAEFSESLPSNLARVVRGGLKLDSKTKTFIYQAIKEWIRIFASTAARELTTK